MDANAAAARAQQDDIVKAAAKLPYSERIVHKNWRVRETVYREIADKFAIAPEDDKIYSDFFPFLAKMARDANAAAQLAAFEAISKYADTAPPQLVRKSAAEVAKAVAEKGLTGRPLNKTKAIDTFVMYVGADAGDVAVDVVSNVGFKHRTPKVVAAALEAITVALETYGSRAIPIKTVVAKIPPLLSHSQEAVRNAAKNLVIQLHRWAGDPVKSCLKKAKEVTVKEIEAACASHTKANRPQPKKLTRSMEQRARRTGGAGDGQDDDDGFGQLSAEEEEPEAELEINLIEKISAMKIEVEENVYKDWYTAVDGKKWSARKDALEQAASVIGDARLALVSYQEVFVRLRKIFAKDSNVKVVASAARLVSTMAGGLRKNFPPGIAKALTVDLFSKLKEKNTIVIDAITKALDALHLKKCIRIVELQEEISTAAKHKAPKARFELLSWLSRSLKSGTAGADLKGAPLKCFGSLLVKATDDSAPEVRDAGLNGLAALQVLVGERNVMAYTEKLDKPRKEKIAAMVAKIPKPGKVAPSKPKASSGPSANTRSKAAKKASPKALKQPRTKESASTPPEPTAKPKPKKAEPLESDDEGEIPFAPQDALTKASEIFEEFEAESWSVKSFRARGAAASIIVSHLGEKEKLSDDEVALILGVLSCEPGLADTNFIAAKPKLELFGLVATKCSSPPPRKTLRPLLLQGMEKLGDIKSAKTVASTLMSFAEATSPRFCMEVLLEAARETKNSRAFIGMLKLGATFVEDFGVPPVPEKDVASLSALGLSNAAPAAKNSAATMACKSALRTGQEKFRRLLEESEAPQEVLEAFDAEMPKYTQKPEPPTRKKRFGAQTPSEEESQDGNPEPEREEEEEPKSELEPEPEQIPEPPSALPTPAVVESKGRIPVRRSQQSAKQYRKRSPIRPRDGLKDSSSTSQKPDVDRTPVPAQRVSIASHFAPGARIFLDLKNSNWKRRQEALEHVLSIIQAANDCVKPNVGSEIILAMRARLNDSNRNLATLAYSVVCRLVRAMGPGGNIHLKVLAPVVLGQGCIDIKKNVREAAMTCLSTFYEVYGMSAVIPHSHHPFSSLNSSIRKEYLEWLVPRLQGQIGSFDSSQEDLSCLIDPCLICLRDRVAEVRHLADMALEQVVRSVGLPAIDSKALSLSKSARLQLQATLEKYRGANQTAPKDSVQASKPPASVTPRSMKERPRSMALPRTPMSRRPSGSIEDSTPASSIRRRRPLSARVTPVTKSGRGSETPRSVKDSTAMLKQNNGREARGNKFMNKRMKLLDELSVSEPSGEIPPIIGESLEDIAEDLPECCSRELIEKLTAPANRFRMHVEAIEMVGTELDKNPDNLVYVADVLFRWAACRIEDSKTPPTVLVKLALFVSSMCEILISSGLKIGEYEATALIPPLAEKCGSYRDSVREAMRSALLSVADVVEEEILLIMYASCLRQPMSERAHNEISIEICQLIDKRCNAGAGLPPGTLSVIGRVAGGEDDGAGCAAAACLERAHEHFGDDLWSLVGELSNSEAALLDDRLTSVINGMKQELGSAHDEAENQVPAPVDLPDSTETVEAHAPKSPFPTDIRNEDFRLSVAPAPPSSVLTSISDSLNMSTPRRTKVELQREGISETPMVASTRQRDGEIVSKHSSKRVMDILSKLRDADRDTQLSALASIFDDLKRDSNLISSSPGAQILLQLFRCFGDTLDRLQRESGFDDDPAVLKSFLKGVIRYAREPNLLRQLDQSAVELLLNNALNAMVPQAVAGVEDWDQVRRGVNLVIVKVLESCDQNLLLTALINLLLINIRAIQRSESEKYSGLAKSSICIKSIAKVAKRGFSNCRVSELLRDIHLFLIANPVRRDGDTSAEDQTFAMRLLKTVVNAIIDEIGSDIRRNLELIPQPEKSQLVHYIDMTLRDLESQDPQEVPTSSGPAPQPAHQNKEYEGNALVEEALSRIVPSDNSDESLRFLLSILRSYPNVDLQSHLDKCSLELREFVSTGLRRIGSGSNSQHSSRGWDGESGDGMILHSQASTQGNLSLTSESSNPASANSAGQVYLKRLHEIQLRYGLQSTTRGQSEAAGRPGFSEKENGELESISSGEDAKGKAYSLRERMARIREMQGASKHVD
ncbi:Armadillo-like helical domain containing protein [Gracilaria domingensis]|nr:Armadillo-like helical domain containing protein [Gracilaria domingensis]